MIFVCLTVFNRGGREERKEQWYDHANVGRNER